MKQTLLDNASKTGLVVSSFSPFVPHTNLTIKKHFKKQRFHQRFVQPRNKEP